MSNDWLPVDEMSRDDAPEWTRARERGLVLGQQGVALGSRRRITAAQWDDILAVTRVEDAVYVLVPRKPPAPPWIEIGEKELPEGVGDLDELVAQLRERLARRGYRQTRVERPLVSPNELVARLKVRRPLPGTVEIPVGRGGSVLEDNDVQLGLGGGGFVGFFGGGMLLQPLALPALAFVAAGVGALVGLVAGKLVSDWKRRGRRVLALAPDGCVMGLPDGVHAFSWAQIGGFHIEHSEREGLRFLVATAPDRSVIGRLHEHWFDRPLELIVAVAEAYRTQLGRPEPE